MVFALKFLELNQEEFLELELVDVVYQAPNHFQSHQDMELTQEHSDECCFFMMMFGMNTHTVYILKELQAIC